MLKPRTRPCASCQQQQEDNPDFVHELADIEASFEFLSPTPTRVVWHQDQAGLIPNSCPGSAHYYEGVGIASADGEGDAYHGGADARRRDDSRYRDQVSTGRSS